MSDLYSVVLMQTNRVGIDHRRDIRKANLDRILEIFGYGPTRLAFRESDRQTIDNLAAYLTEVVGAGA